MPDRPAARPARSLGLSAALWLTSEGDKLATLLRGVFTDAAGREKLWDEHQDRYTRRFFRGFERDTP